LKKPVFLPLFARSWHEIADSCHDLAQSAGPKIGLVSDNPFVCNIGFCLKAKKKLINSQVNFLGYAIQLIELTDAVYLSRPAAY